MHNFFYNSKLGQNFLIDSKIIDKIISSICPKKYDFMVEIGPGLGALTYPICNILKQLVVIEYDKKLGSKLFNNLDNVKVFINDALKFDFFNLTRYSDKKIRMIGNLPYNISVSLLIYLFQFSDKIIDIHFMFQKEVADRLLAIPGTKSYGCLSIITQYYFTVQWLFNISPDSFYPKPNVFSTLVRLIPCRIKKFYVKDINILSYITKLAFSQRRKKIKNSLSSLFDIDALQKFSINPNLRAEDLSLEQYCLLSNIIRTK
ncbi:MAG: 16S rRNA (adenine(1518)-N(6)/adenine(1519)-N(6))-dimethyltransferase RsmA [Buchnera aphidicola (Chaetogeoica yunlongensis)]